MNKLAKRFHSLGESQQQRCEKVIKLAKEKHNEFLAFEKEQAKLY